MWFPWSSVCLFHCFKTLHIILCNQFCVLHKLLLLFHFVMYGLTLSLNCCSMVGDIMTTQMMVTNRKYKAYMTRVPVDCLILGQQLQQHEQAAEPQQQASCRQRTMGKPLPYQFHIFQHQYHILCFPYHYIRGAAQRRTCIFIKSMLNYILH